MAAPNIVNVTTIIAKTAVANVTTVPSNVIVNTSNSSTVVKINSVVFTNYSGGSVVGWVDLYRSNTSYAIAGNITIPANSTMVVTGKDTAIYLEEGDVLRSNASANVAATLTSSYEIIS
jgi:hypothetical protein